MYKSWGGRIILLKIQKTVSEKKKELLKDPTSQVCQLKNLWKRKLSITISLLQIIYILFRPERAGNFKKTNSMAFFTCFDCKRIMRLKIASLKQAVEFSTSKSCSMILKDRSKPPHSSYTKKNSDNAFDIKIS